MWKTVWKAIWVEAGKTKDTIIAAQAKDNGGFEQDFNNEDGE